MSYGGFYTVGNCRIISLSRNSGRFVAVFSWVAYVPSVTTTLNVRALVCPTKLAAGSTNGALNYPLRWPFRYSRRTRAEYEHLFKHSARVLQDRLARLGGGDRTKEIPIAEG